MGAMSLLNHVLNFLAPALWLASGLTLMSRIFMKNQAPAHSPLAQAAILSAAGSGVLLLGLLLLGRDGKMLTYCALVLVCASVQAWLLRDGQGK
jgi:hypothetical protein